MNNTTPAPSGGTPLLVHGTLTAYHRHGCRCAPCTANATEYSATRSRLKAYGRWQPTLPADPVHAHLAVLRDVPLTYREIATRTGLGERRIRQIIANRPHRIRTADAQRILDLPVPAARPSSLLAIDATATRRRLQALITIGYPMPAITRTAGIASKNLWDVIHGRQTAVTVTTEAAVSCVYDQLWDGNPADHGVWPRHANRARALAATHRWAPPMAWDDDTIHDPAAMPNWTGRCGTPGGYYDHTQIGTPTCQPCRDAVAAAAASRKARRRQRQDAA